MSQNLALSKTLYFDVLASSRFSLWSGPYRTSAASRGGRRKLAPLAIAVAHSLQRLRRSACCRLRRALEREDDLRNQLPRGRLQPALLQPLLKRRLHPNDRRLGLNVGPEYLPTRSPRSCNVERVDVHVVSLRSRQFSFQPLEDSKHHSCRQDRLCTKVRAPSRLSSNAASETGDSLRRAA